MVKSGSAPRRETTETLVLEDYLPYRLSVVTNRVSKAFSRFYESEFGLSVPEWRVMAVLARFAPVSSNEVCERTAMDKAKVSRSISKLIAADLVVRKTNPIDHRLIMLTLSRRGRKVHQKIVPLAKEWEEQLLEALEADEREQLSRLLRKLDDRVDELTPKA